jgi:hypothetical protein
MDGQLAWKRLVLLGAFLLCAGPMSLGCGDLREPMEADELGLHTAPEGPKTMALVDWFTRAVVADATHVYWLVGRSDISAPAIMRMPKAGGSSTTVLSLGFEFPLALAMDGGTLFYTTSTRVGAVNPDGTSHRILAAGLDLETNALALDGSALYVVDGNRTQVRRIPRSGGTPMTLATGVAVRGVASDGIHAFYLDDVGGDGRVMRVPTSGGTPVILASAQPGVQFLAVAGSYVFWVNGGTTETAGANTLIKRVAKTGGTPSTVRTVGTRVGGMVLDGSYIFWTEPDRDLVRRIRHGGGTTSYVTSNEHRPVTIGLGPTEVFWLLPHAAGEELILRTIPKTDVSGSVCSTSPSAVAAPNTPEGLAATKTWIYYSIRGTGPDTGSVWRVWRNGSSVSELLAQTRTEPSELIADADGAYWAEPQGTGYRVYALDNSEIHIGGRDDVRAVATGWSLFETLGVAGLAVDSASIYVIEGPGGRVFRTVKHGEPQSTDFLATIDGDGAGGSQSASYLYVAHSTRAGEAAVTRINKTTRSIRRVATIPGQKAGRVLYNSSYVYFITLGIEARIYRVPSAGGTVQLLWRGVDAPYDLKVLDSYLYFDTDSGDLWRMPRSGGTPIRLADYPGVGWELDADSSCLTYALEKPDGTGELVKVSD